MSTTLPRILLRRWYVALLGVVATAALVLAASTLIGPTYQITANVLLVPPPAKPGSNPYLELGGLEPVADVLARSLSDYPVSAKLKAAGLSGKFVVGRDQTVSGPVLLLTTEASTATEARNLMTALVGLVAPQLRDLQAHASVPVTAMLTTQLLYDAHDPKRVTKTQMRGEVAAGVVGLLMTLVVIIGLDRLLRGRTQRRTAAKNSGENAGRVAVGPPTAGSAPGTADLGPNATPVDMGAMGRSSRRAVSSKGKRAHPSAETPLGSLERTSRRT